MKILVLHTGGTIASADDNGVIKAVTSFPVVEKFKEKDGDYVFDNEIIANILSENANSGFYEKIINTLAKKDLSQYSGVIIMHGTDTLSFTSSIVAMALRHIDIPVCFVSANKILSDKNSNALDNFTLAVGYITCGGKGFVVPYRNPDGRCLIHLATRLNQADFATDSFSCAGFTPYAEVVKNSIVFYDDKTGISNRTLCAPLKKLLNCELTLKNKVLLINPYPDIDYSVYDLEKTKPAAVLHTSYHSGTANAYALEPFIEKCRNLGIEFYFSPVKKNEAMYETTKLICGNAAKPLYNMTVESALAKIKLSVNCKNFSTNENLYYEEF